ncbi:MAG: hypothetical protein M1820_010129 [Bogoriella megaspora]|nr:MAG: hypothetical protein M1820_010129 [Bogoriella megaspora]
MPEPPSGQPSDHNGFWTFEDNDALIIGYTAAVYWAPYRHQVKQDVWQVWVYAGPEYRPGGRGGRMDVGTTVAKWTLSESPGRRLPSFSTTGVEFRAWTLGNMTVDRCGWIEG